MVYDARSVKMIESLWNQVLIFMFLPPIMVYVACYLIRRGGRREVFKIFGVAFGLCWWLYWSGIIGNCCHNMVDASMWNRNPFEVLARTSGLDNLTSDMITAINVFRGWVFSSFHY